MVAARNKKAQVSTLPTLPGGLVEAIKNRRVVLFLGAGASMEARGDKGERPLSARDLRDRLASDFLGRSFDDADLMSVADMAIESSGQSVVFERIRSLLSPLRPTRGHLLLPTFRWRAIVTTNYDDLVERAYRAGVRNQLQGIVPIVKNTEPVEELLQSTEHPVLLLKLHGCVNHAHDEQVPLVLSHDHYALHDRHRDNLYSRLNQWTHESTFVFCGYGIGDAHIRNILHKLDADGVKRPNYFVVTPVMDEVQADYWSKKKVTLIQSTFGGFMDALDAEIPEMWRSLEAGQGMKELSVRKHFRTNRDPTPKLLTALDRDLRHVHASMAADPQDPRRFYEGFDTGWGAILQNLDISRRITNDLLMKAVIEEDSPTGCHLILLRGPAGSGKSVAAKRAAMTTATDLDQVALWLEADGALRADTILELADLTGKRIFVFVDRAALHLAAIEVLLKAAAQKNAPVTVVAAERDNEWNVFAGRVSERWKPAEFRMSNLAPREIEDLVDVLDRHKSLGLLSTQTRPQRIEAFQKRADRQLLVALHEATRGKAFEDIVHDEYVGIIPDRAKRLYLDICSLNQFAIPVRAGTISRVSGLRFEEYRTELFDPLENVVLTDENRYTGDIEYRARHPKVAEFVFQGACPTDEAKSAQLTRMIEHLDVGFQPDRTAIENISKGRTLSGILSGAVHGRDIYAALTKALPDAAFVLQQWAIFEYTASDGSLLEAERLASRAKELDPRSKSISHTLSEVARRRAGVERSPILKEQLRRQARKRLTDAGSATDMLVMSSKCKILVDEVKDLVAGIGEEQDDVAATKLADLVREAETEIRQAKQIYHDVADLEETQWRLNVVLERHSKARSALERAWRLQPRGAGVGLRLAKAYASDGETGKAALIMKDALERFPDDRSVHFEMGRLLLRTEDELSSRVGEHLARSYSPGDRNYAARHLHAQYLFHVGEARKAEALFQDVDERAPPEFRDRTTAPDKGLARHLQRVVGRVTKKDSTYCFIRSPSYGKDIYANERNSDVAVWEAIRSNTQVDFDVMFRRNGPIAHNLRPISS